MAGRKRGSIMLHKGRPSPVGRLANKEDMVVSTVVPGQAAMHASGAFGLPDAGYTKAQVFVGTPHSLIQVSC